MIEHLVVGHPFLLNLFAGKIPEKLPSTFKLLKYLELSDLPLKYKEVAMFAICLIRSCPNLKKLRIKGCRGCDVNLTSPESLVKAQEPWEDSLNQLQEVRMEVFCGTWPELEFLKCLLAKSLVLEKIIIQTEVEIGLKILRDVLRLRRASPRTEILFLDPEED
ncbi:F-box/FBD/LRR-repeat protein [Tripterygium wilfordii]|uniref:F-box/FBD/LRR-repeat protein n=1 Tax=Tripterygium wilfordii TaxID=458696 RepID=A0A7J7E0C3_TRIWF|nr:uncharacterized protein LOC120013657 [Tripterygium wilfordii]KAF5751979.1 F-box/FBD/LRR-repeat protein [Tripterygium wilfordii]